MPKPKLDSVNINSAYEKYSDWIIFGPKIPTELAWEIIRRTDGFFCADNGWSPYSHEVRRLLGLPKMADFPGVDLAHADNEFERALRNYVVKWGLLGAPRNAWVPEPGLLGNRMIASGYGWCYPDGTIALTGEVKRGYPLSILNECEWLADAFPKLKLSLAYWGRKKRWEAPSFGIVVRQARAVAMSGEDPALRASFDGSTWESIRDLTLRASLRARRILASESRFGDRTDPDHPATLCTGVPDAAIMIWIEKARSLGLVA